MVRRAASRPRPDPRVGGTSPKVSVSPARIVAAACAVCLTLALAGCATHGSSFLAPHGMVAGAQRRWLLDTLALMAIVVVPAVVLAPLFAWRYRHGRKAAYSPNWGFSWPLEFLIWGAPLAIVAVLGGYVFGPEARLDPYRRLPVEGPVLHIDVVALNWKWLFIYPEQGIASVGAVALPVGRNVEFDLTSDSTMQSFLIPALGSQIYAMAGMVTRLNLEASSVGDFMGENTQFNGVGFQEDRFSALAMTPADFAGWVAAAKSSPLKLDKTSYDVLHQDSTADEAAEALGLAPGPEGAFRFSAVPEGFFRSVVARYRGSAAEEMAQ